MVAGFISSILALENLEVHYPNTNFISNLTMSRRENESEIFDAWMNFSKLNLWL